MTSHGKAFIEAFDWPYQGVTDARALLEMEHGNVATEEVIAIVHEYGVGYMLSDFGITLDQYQIGMDYSKVYPRFRYTDEPYFAMITDITSTMEELGYGWCFAH